MIFFTSDTHFGHNKIATLRGFESPEDMDNFIVSIWNNQVADSDTVFHLGDVCMGKIKESIPILEKLKGKKFLVHGNHDNSNKIKILSQFFETLPPIHRLKSKWICHELGRNVACGAFLCHYPMLDWGQPVWHLHGHFHGDKLPYTPKGAIFDVSFDNGMNLWDYDALEAMVPKCYESERHSY